MESPSQSFRRINDFIPGLMKRTVAKTGTRLVLGFSLILLIYLVSIFMGAKAFYRVIEATREIVERQSTMAASLKLALTVEKQYAHELLYILTQDTKQCTLFREAANEISSLQSKISEQLKGDLAVKADLHELDRELTKFRELFEQELVPAVFDRDIDRTQQVREQAHASKDRIIGIAERIRDHISKQITTANRTAQNVAYYAKIQSIGFFLFAFVISIIVAAYLTRSILNPIRVLTAGLRRVARGDLNQPIQLQREDEFGMLAQSFNKMMSDLRHSQAQLIRTEKLASIGRLAAGVAHEINNPIGIILGYARLMISAKGQNDPDCEDLKTIEEEALQCKRIVEDLLDLSRPERIENDVIDPTALVQEVIEKTKTMDRAEKVEFVTEFDPEPLMVFGDRGKLRQAVTNIVNNAIDAMNGEGRMRIRIYSSNGPRGPNAPPPEIAEKPFVILEFHDTGPGISPDNLDKIFEPFFTTKEKGTGLGLAITYGIIKAHEGFIFAESEEGKGTTFLISLPLYKQPQTEDRQ